MRPLDWDKLRVFQAVAHEGNLTHASKKLHISQSALSRQISSLEYALGISLFHRHARGLILTEQGEILYNTTQQVFHDLEASITRVQETNHEPSGPLIINATLGLGSIWLSTILDEFIDQFPKIDLSLILSPQANMDIAMREADLSIRLFPPKQSDLIQTRLMTYRHGVYASSNYLKKYGIPENLDDLEQHRILAFGKHTDDTHPYPEIDWLLQYERSKDNPRQPAVVINSVTAIIQAVLHDVGIASLPKYLVREETGLIEVLQNIKAPLTDVWMVYPEELRKSKRISVFIAFMRQKTQAFIQNKTAII